jgi:isocitrate lyase
MAKNKKSKVKRRKNPELNDRASYEKNEVPENNAEVFDAARGYSDTEEQKKSREKDEENQLKKDKNGNPILPKLTDDLLKKKVDKNYQPLVEDLFKEAEAKIKDIFKLDS